MGECTRWGIGPEARIAVEKMVKGLFLPQGIAFNGEKAEPLHRVIAPR